MNWQRYIIALIITSAVFGTAIALSTMLNNAKLQEVRTIEESMSIDILSLETQFDLLQELSCDQITASSVLSPELDDLAQRLSFMEESLGTDNDEVLRLKRRYSLLQIKDLLLMRKVSEKCHIAPTVIIYFYSNEGDCKECTRQGYVLTRLQKDNPDLRVYAFDAHLDLSAVQTLARINDVGTELPVLIVNGATYTGLKNLEAMYALVPELKPKEEVATSSESDTVSPTPE